MKEKLDAINARCLTLVNETLGALFEYRNSLKAAEKAVPKENCVDLYFARMILKGADEALYNLEAILKKARNRVNDLF